MSTSNVHLSYVSALMKVSKELDCGRVVMDELAELALSLKHSELSTLFKSLTTLAPTQQRQLLEKGLSGKVHRVTLNLLIHLTSKKRVALLPLIAETFATRVCDEHKIAKLNIHTAMGLTSAGEAQIMSMLKKVHGPEMSVTFEVSPELIGGIQVYEKGSVTDYSVKNYLDTLRKSLMESN